MNYHTIVTLAVGAIIVDTIVGYILLLTKSGKTIRQWYSEFTIGAYAMDITSLTIGTYIATLLTPNFYLQFVYVVIVGLIHDISFALFLNSVNTKGSKILQFFKDYAKEYGKKILLIDALMLVSTLLVSNVLLNSLSNANTIFLGVLTFYFGLLMVYSF
jgi:hypothetical protein